MARNFDLYLVGHAHIDLGYRWRWDETVHRIARDTFRGVLRLMDEIPDFTFVQSQLALYEAVKQHYPEMYAQIRQRIAEGRWIVADGWCEYDQTMPSGESMIRQHLLGSRYARQELGVDIDLAWAPDAFSGHAHTLPSILKGCGIARFLYGRGVPDEVGPVFWWEGPDGSRVLAYSPLYGYSAVMGPRVFEHIARWKERTDIPAMLYLYGRGDHGGGPRVGDFEAIAELACEPDAPRFIHATPQRYFAEVLEARSDLPIYRGELGHGFTGSLSSEGRAKQRNRQMENLLLTAERFATFAMFLQRKPAYPRVYLQDAWRGVLRHQFHDELPGTSRAPVYRDNDDDYDRIQAMAEGILDDWQRSEPVRVTLRLGAPPQHIEICDTDGRTMPTQTLRTWQEGHYWRAEVLFVARDVPPLGYRVYRARSHEREDDIEDADILVVETQDVIVLQTSYLLVTIDQRTGHVISVIDKQSGSEALVGPANVLQAIAEVPGRSTGWIIALSDEMDELYTPESIEVIRNGTVQATARVAYRWRDSYFCQEISLYARQPYVDFCLHAEWYERDRCLKIAFPTTVSDGEATFEAPLGAISRPADGAEAPAQRWIDISNGEMGVSLLNDCRYAFDILNGTMRMTALRGIPDLDPEADVGEHHLHYALYPHTGDWRQGSTVRRGWAFNMPLIARQALRRAGVIAPWIAPGINHAMPPAFGFLEVHPDNVVVTAFKLEQEDWGPGAPVILRLYETDGRPTEARIAFAAPLMMLEETNHLEEPIESSAFHWEENVATISFRAHEIKTFRFALAVPGFAIYEGEEHRDDVAPGFLPGLEGG